MITLSISVILVLVLVLWVVIAIMERKRKSEGVLVSSNYRRLCIMGITIVIVSIGAMIAFYILQIPFLIGVPLFATGIACLIIGLVNRREWNKELDKWIG